MLGGNLLLRSYRSTRSRVLDQAQVAILADLLAADDLGNQTSSADDELLLLQVLGSCPPDTFWLDRSRDCG
jgi:hypothetical protein